MNTECDTKKNQYAIKIKKIFNCSNAVELLWIQNHKKVWNLKVFPIFANQVSGSLTLSSRVSEPDIWLAKMGNSQCLS